MFNPLLLRCDRYRQQHALASPNFVPPSSTKGLPARLVTFLTLFMLAALASSTHASQGSQVDFPDCPPPPEQVSTTGATVLGNGTPGSITTAQLQAALDSGGTVLLDLGPSPTSLALDAELVVSRETAIDGGGLVTLDGGNGQRIVQITNPSNLAYTLTLQNIGFANGATPSGSGAAIYKPSGGPWQAVRLVVIDSWFEDNIAVAVDQDGGGGAIYATGLDEVIVSGSSFTNNRGSNGGAIYSLGSRVVTILDSDFESNRATGTDGNPGNGGNGGAIGIDGAERHASLCDVRLRNNQANAFGAGFFTVMYDDLSLTEFKACTFEGNTNPSDTFGFAGGAYLQGGPISISGTSFLGNSARGNGALFLGPGVSGELINSTFFGNVARTSLGGAMSIDSSAAVAITFCTIAGNSAPGPVSFAGGISNSASNQIILTNTILANNTGGNEFNPWNIRFPVNVDGGGNLQFPQTRPNGQPEPAATPTVLWADPLLEDPASNLGPTLTMALDPISPAVDMGIGSATPITDQRGILRVGLVDIGAYEVNDSIFVDGFETGDLGRWTAVVGPILDSRLPDPSFRPYPAPSRRPQAVPRKLSSSPCEPR